MNKITTVFPRVTYLQGLFPLRLSHSQSSSFNCIFNIDSLLVLLPGVSLGVLCPQGSHSATYTEHMLWKSMLKNLFNLNLIHLFVFITHSGTVKIVKYIWHTLERYFSLAINLYFIPSRLVKLSIGLHCNKWYGFNKLLVPDSPRIFYLKVAKI